MGEEKRASASDSLPPLTACCVAEVVGTFLLVFLGCGAVHVAVLLNDLSGLWQVAVVWGVAVMLAIYVAGAISGAHINPAITVGLAFWKLFPRGRVVPYVAAQVSGAFLAACVLYLVFHPFLARKEREKGVVRGQPGSEISAMCYCEYFPSPGPLAASADVYSPQAAELHRGTVSEPIACFAEMLGTAILALVVMAVTNKNNLIGPGQLAPVFIGLTVAVLIVVIAPLTQACFNPARDFGPRLFAFLAGWGEIAIPGPRGAGFFTVYILSPAVGAIGGVALHRWLFQPFLLGFRDREL